VTDTGQLPVLFLACPLPVRPCRGKDVFVRTTLRLEFRLRSASPFGIPHGADRMILLLLATLAARQQSPELDLGSAGQILRFFGLSPDGRNYERLAQRFDRVLRSSFEFSFRPLPNGDVARPRVMSVCQDRRLWFDQPAKSQRKFTNSLVLTDGFWKELQRSKVIIPMDPYRALLDSPGNLDLYLFILAQSQIVRPGQYVRIPLVGESSLASGLGVSGYSQPRDFRRRVRLWLHQIRRVWTACPAVVSSDANHILICHSSLNASVITNMVKNSATYQGSAQA
jgi:hypothetical protein